MKDICYNLETAIEQRKNEIERGVGIRDN